MSGGLAVRTLATVAVKFARALWMLTQWSEPVPFLWNGASSGVELSIVMKACRSVASTTQAPPRYFTTLVVESMERGVDGSRVSGRGELELRSGPVPTA